MRVFCINQNIYREYTIFPSSVKSPFLLSENIVKISHTRFGIPCFFGHFVPLLHNTCAHTKDNSCH